MALSHLKGRCHVWTPPVLQGKNGLETAVELAVMYPAFLLRYADWSCPVKVPDTYLIHAGSVSNASGLLPPRAGSD